MRIPATLSAILCCNTATLGQLTNHEFVEAIGILYVDPGTLAACGVPNDTIEPIWAAVESDSARWMSYVQARESLRNAGRLSEDVSTADMINQIDVAETNLQQLLSEWRESILQLVPEPHAGKIRLVGLQRKLALPVWLLTVRWSAQQARSLERGFAAVTNQRLHDHPASGSDVVLYQSIHQQAEVVEAKSNFEILLPIYTERFVNFADRSR